MYISRERLPLCPSFSAYHH